MPRFKPVFILSTGRSGSTTLARVLSLVDGCVCLHEPAPELILESAGYRYGTVSAEKIKNILIQTRTPQINGSLYCESNQTLSLLIPVLADSFPDAGYIWLIRNGRDFVASAMQKQWYTGHSENHDRYEDCSKIEKQWIDGRIEGDRCNNMEADAWGSMDRFERCCWYWSYINETINKELHIYAPEKSITLYLETMHKQLRKTVRWMGLRMSFTPAAVQLNKAKRTPYAWHKWSKRECAVFEKWCGRLMDTHYPQWRTQSNEWRGIPYETSLFFHSFRSNRRFIALCNKIFAPNKKI